jgi:NADPH-dependent 2,4-dienoyl-CoA reductase/sulfur reductase-like enzyme
VRIVVVGASVAGVTTAEALRAEGFDGEVVLIGDEPHAPYARPPLSKQVLDGSWEPARAALRTVAELDALDVELRTGTPATALDTGRQVVTAGCPVPYDVLVIATGVAPAPLAVPGGEAALRLRTLDDASTLRRAMTGAGSDSGSRSGFRSGSGTASATGPIAVIGAGVLGSELASAARHLGREVVLIGRRDRQAFGTLGTLLSDRLAALHAAHGVQLRTGSAVVRLDAHPDGDGGGVDVVLADGTVIASAFVVAAVGGRPRTEWLSGSGLVIDDGVACDAAGRAIHGAVPVPGVFAVGDVAAWTDPVSGHPVRVEHQTTAIEQGLAVARTIVHGQSTLPGSSAAPPVPYFWSEVHGVRIQAYGTFDDARPLATLDAGAAGPDSFVAASVDEHGRTTGVVGWAAARAFRAARSLVDASRSRTPATASPTAAPATTTPTTTSV